MNEINVAPNSRFESDAKRAVRAGHRDTLAASMDAERIIGIVVFVIVVVAFIYDRIFGWRALGITEVAYGIWVIWTRRVSYGWEGRPPSGYITGRLAVIVGLLAIGLGAVFVLVPEVIDEALSNAQRGS